MNKRLMCGLAFVSFFPVLSASVHAQSSGSARVYNQRALTRFTKGDMDGAIADLDIAIKFDPSYEKAYSNRGNARLAKGNVEGAIADYDRAIGLNPRAADAYNNRGNAMRARGHIDAAIADYSQAIAIEPRLAEAYSSRGSTRVAKGEIEGAIADYSRATSGSLISGVGDVAFIGDTLYAILAGAGCSHGVAGTHNAILRVNTDGTTTEIANLSAFQQANPVENPEPDDFEPDGTWYSMVAVRGELYAVEPNTVNWTGSRPGARSRGWLTSRRAKATQCRRQLPTMAISMWGT